MCIRDSAIIAKAGGSNRVEAGLVGLALGIFARRDNANALPF
jgi:hypothetical protein